MTRLVDFYSKLDKHINRLGWNKKILGIVNEWPILLISNESKKKKNVLVVAGLHGDEIAGPLGILNYLENLKSDPQINISIIPLANPIGFGLGIRGNQDGIDINRGYDETENSAKEKEIFEKNIDLLTHVGRDGVLTLHEDNDMEEFYLYTYEPEDDPDAIFPHFLEIGKKSFGIPEEFDVLDVDGIPNGEKIYKGVVFSEDDKTLESLLKDKVGHTKVITTETPAKMSVNSRVEVNMELVRQFVECFKENR